LGILQDLRKAQNLQNTLSFLGWGGAAPLVQSSFRTSLAHMAL
jgi:hypothetical protein